MFETKKDLRESRDMWREEWGKALLARLALEKEIDYQNRYIKGLENEVQDLRDKLERIDCVLTED